jgi:hypothetical protein
MVSNIYDYLHTVFDILNRDIKENGGLTLPRLDPCGSDVHIQDPCQVRIQNTLIIIVVSSKLPSALYKETRLRW